MTILDQIIAHKRKEVAAAKRRLPLPLLKLRLKGRAAPARRLLRSGQLQLITEIKRRSPSAGAIRKKIDAGMLAREFARQGARAISVLTDKKYFGGDIEDLAAARSTVRVPILRKEFIIDEYQLYESKFYGADMVLLIASVLKSGIGTFADLALKLRLQPVIEVRDKNELKMVLRQVKPSPRIAIGVNNRDLRTFKVALGASFRLVDAIPRKFMRISESGISRTGQLDDLQRAGFDGVLIGTGLAKNPGLLNYFKK